MWKTFLKGKSSESQSRRFWLLSAFFIASLLAITLAAQGRFEQALAENEEALRLKPELPGARNCRALWWLQQGDCARGWPEYEWRWQVRGVTRRTFREPAWDGIACSASGASHHVRVEDDGDQHERNRP
jgi:tetratricopeptide (TPR) repeat protein